MLPKNIYIYIIYFKYYYRFEFNFGKDLDNIVSLKLIIAINK